MNIESIEEEVNKEQSDVFRWGWELLLPWGILVYKTFGIFYNISEDIFLLKMSLETC